MSEKLTIKDCKALAAVTGGLTLVEGLVLLNRLSDCYPLRIIYLDGRSNSRMPFKDLTMTPDNNYSLLDRLGAIWFKGGPEGVYWYRGTPRTFVMDCLLHATVLFGEEHVSQGIFDYYTTGAP